MYSSSSSSSNSWLSLLPFTLEPPGLWLVCHPNSRWNNAAVAFVCIYKYIYIHHSHCERQYLSIVSCPLAMLEFFVLLKKKIWTPNTSCSRWPHVTFISLFNSDKNLKKKEEESGIEIKSFLYVYILFFWQILNWEWTAPTTGKTRAAR